MNRSEIAINKFKEGYNCSQSILLSFSDLLKIERDFALKLATGFGAGMGRKQEVCGAVSGGILVLSILYGRGENEDRAKQELTYSKIQELINKFEEKHSTINCKNLLDGCNFLTTEGQNMFKSEKMIERCYGYVGFVVEILEEIITT